VITQQIPASNVSLRARPAMVVVKTNVKHVSMNIFILIRYASLAMKIALPAMESHRMSATHASQEYRSYKIHVFPAGMGITLMFHKINAKLVTQRARLVMEVA
jgi:hypothetical protein